MRDDHDRHGAAARRDRHRLTVEIGAGDGRNRLPDGRIGRSVGIQCGKRIAADADRGGRRLGQPAPAEATQRHREDGQQYDDADDGQADEKGCARRSRLDVRASRHAAGSLSLGRHALVSSSDRCARRASSSRVMIDRKPASAMVGMVTKPTTWT